jgi:hypothetical protein
MSQDGSGSTGASRNKRTVSLAIVLLIALISSCGHKSQSGVWSRGPGVKERNENSSVSVFDSGLKTQDSGLLALKEYAASLPPVAGQVVEPIPFGERQPDGTYIRDGRKMTLGEILASAPKVACPPLTQIRLPDSAARGTVVAASATKQASSVKKAAGGMLISPPNFKPYSPFGPLPGFGSGSGSIGVAPPPPTPPTPPPPGQGVGPLYDPNPIRFTVPDGPPVDVAFLKMGPNSAYPALAALTKHVIHIYAGVGTFNWSGSGTGGGVAWSGRFDIPVPSQVITWDPDPAYRHTVDGAWAVRLRVADLNNDGRDDLVVVTNWDDPAWPQGANQFGYNGTWVYYQNWSGYFDEPFSPGGASREYDIAEVNSTYFWHEGKSLLPDLMGVQNPHVPTLVNAPGQNKPYPWDMFASEYYDHQKFKDAGPALPPVPVGAEGTVDPTDLAWFWSIEKTHAVPFHKWDDYVFTEKLYGIDYGSPSRNVHMYYDVIGVCYAKSPDDSRDGGYGGFEPAGFPTTDEPFRARPGRCEPGETIDDFVATFPSVNSLQVAHPTYPSQWSQPWPVYELYSPKILLRAGSDITPITAPCEVQPSDLNGDGLTDTVVLSDSRLYVLLNLGNRTFIVTDEFPVTDGVQRAAVGSVFGGRQNIIAAIDSPSSSVLLFRPLLQT